MCLTSTFFYRCVCVPQALGAGGRAEARDRGGGRAAHPAHPRGRDGRHSADPHDQPPGEKKFLIDNLLVRIHFVIVMIRWTGLAPWEFELPFPGSLTSTFLYRIDLG